MCLIKDKTEICTDTFQLDQVEKFLETIFEENNIDKQLFIRVLVCLNEAVVNSISHGNQYITDKKIVIQAEHDSKYLLLRITDEGCGFDLNDLEDPTSLKNIKKETGRGIHIIRKLCDTVVFNEKGNMIEFKIKLDV